MCTGIGTKGYNSWSYVAWKVFKQFKMHLLNNLYVCSPTSMKLKSNLVSKVREV